MVKSGFKKHWENVRNKQNLNFTNAINRIKGTHGTSKFYTIPELEDAYNKKYISKKHKDTLIKLQERLKK